MKATLEQIEDALPNGLHDSILRGMRIDYAARKASFSIDVLVSTPESGDASKYRSLELSIDEVLLIVIDPPSSLEAAGKRLTLDAGPGQPSTAPVTLPTLPQDCFLHWLFVRQWNSFIRFAARSASFKWADESS